jgi:hypothetical protein
MSSSTSVPTTPATPTSPTSAERSSALRHRLDGLLREHAEVKLRVQEYQRRRWLSAGETLELKTLQRLKLHKKDAIAAVETELTTLELTFQLD